MTIKIPRWLLVTVALLVVGAAGVGVGYVVSGDSPTPSTTTSTSTTTEVSTSTSTSTTTTETTAETAPEQDTAFGGLAGGQVIQELIDTGTISSATSVAPRPGWDAQYKLDRGGVVVRLRDTSGDREITWSYLTTAQGRAVDHALSDIAKLHGYDVSQTDVSLDPPLDSAPLDPTPEKIDGTPSQEFEPNDIARAEAASPAVQDYCAGAVSEAQRLGCLSHVTESDIP